MNAQKTNIGLAAATPEDRERVLSGLPLFFRLAANMASRIRYGALRFILPDGRELLFQGAEESDAEGVICVRDYKFARRAVLGRYRIF